MELSPSRVVLSTPGHVAALEDFFMARLRALEPPRGTHVPFYSSVLGTRCHEPRLDAAYWGDADERHAAAESLLQLQDTDGGWPGDYV